MAWYYANLEEQHGPFDHDSFQVLVQQGIVRPETLVRREEHRVWSPYEELGTSSAVHATPPPLPTKQASKSGYSDTLQRMFYIVLLVRAGVDVYFNMAIVAYASDFFAGTKLVVWILQLVIFPLYIISLALGILALIELSSIPSRAQRAGLVFSLVFTCLLPLGWIVSYIALQGNGEENLFSYEQYLSVTYGRHLFYFACGVWGLLQLRERRARSRALDQELAQ